MSKLSTNMFFKYSTDDEEFFKETDFLKAKFVKIDYGLPATRSGNRGITQKKKDAIIKKLESVMPNNRVPFFHNLSVNNASVDLTTEQE